MSKAQTDNSYLIEKINLRINHLPKKQKITVLDAYGGRQTIWKKIKKRIKNITVLSIDAKEVGNRVYLKGDNRKFLKSININLFDVIDLDSYGIPYEQLKIIFLRCKKPIHIFCTIIQSVYGAIPKKLLKEVGYNVAMIKKCPTLFNKNGFKIICQWLAQNGIRTIYHTQRSNKHYIYFYLDICNYKEYNSIHEKNLE